MSLFGLRCFAVFCSCTRAPSPYHHLHLSIFVSICLKTFFFYICSPNYRLISCSASESVSPVKPAPRKSPFDTEGLGSHQVMGDCPWGSAGGRCHYPGHGRERPADRQVDTEGLGGCLRRTTRTCVEESDRSRGSPSADGPLGAWLPQPACSWEVACETGGVPQLRREVNPASCIAH